MKYAPIKPVYTPMPNNLYLIDAVPIPQIGESAPPSVNDQMEEALKARFVSIVGGLFVSQHVATMPGRRPNRSLDYFNFVPITPRIAGSRSTVSMGYWCNVPGNYRLTYTHNNYTDNNGRPYIDTQAAIGLTGGDWLIAVASACIQDGGLKVVQIQDVTSNKTNDPDNKAARRAHFKSGLYDGFYWRDTLVSAWEAVARAIGSPCIRILSAVNSDYPALNSAGFHEGYDGVAQRMHFSRLPNKDWEKVL